MATGRNLTSETAKVIRKGNVTTELRQIVGHETRPFIASEQLSKLIGGYAVR